MKTQWIGTLAVLATLAAPSLAHKESEGKLVPSDLSAGDQFGFSVDIDAATAVAAAPRHDDLGSDSGAVYVYARTGTSWLEEAKLTASDGAAGAIFGYSVAIDADTIVVGAPFADAVGVQSGSVYVFVRSGTTWVEQAILVPSSFSAGDRFGFQVAISGDTLIAGSPNLNGVGVKSGAAFVFARTGSTWTEQGMLSASDGAARDFFGTSVSVDQDRALVGSILADGAMTGTGAAYLYERTAGVWSEDHKFTEAESTEGDQFGAGVSVRGNQIAIGAPGHDAFGSSSGQAFFYTEVGGVWTPQVTRFGNASGDNFGKSIDNQASGYSLVGAAGDDELEFNAGKAYLYTHQPPPAFAFEILLSEEAEEDDMLGVSVALSPQCWAIVGAHGHDDAGIDAGSADIFALTKNPTHYCTAGTSTSGCQATVEASGVPSSIAQGGFIIEAANIEASKDGFFFFSSNGQQALPWGNSDGFLCVTAPVKRGGLMPGVGTQGTCEGFASLDLNQRWQDRPPQNPGPGASVQIQFYYRDPANTSGQTSSLSDALEVVTCP